MKRVGRAGPICRRAFARPYKLMVIGNYSFWITQSGSLKGGKPMLLGCGSARAVPVTGGHLSKTAGAEVFRPTLNPARGQHRRGSDPSLCADEAHQFGSNLETRLRPQGVDRGAGLSKRRPALGSLRVNLESGTAGSNPAAPAAHAGQPSNGKSLQWIERLKRSPSPN